MKNRISWSDISQSVYLYGSDITIDKGRVRLSNPLLPVGAIIKEWQSQCNYQSDRHFPELPLLKRGRTYSLISKCDTKPANTVYIQLEFYDRYNRRIGQIVLKEQEDTFTYPKNAYSYTMRLLNAGCQYLSLEYIEIEELDKEYHSTEDEMIVEYDSLLYETPLPHVTVVFLEPGHFLSKNISELLQRRGNIVLIKDTLEMMTDAFYVKITEIIRWSTNEKKVPGIDFVGYGPFGNLAALKIVNDFTEARAFITDYWYSPYKYTTCLTVDKPYASREYIQAILQEKKHERLIAYGAISVNRDLQRVASVLSTPEQLDYLPQLK